MIQKVDLDKFFKSVSMLKIINGNGKLQTSIIMLIRFEDIMNNHAKLS